MKWTIDKSSQILFIGVVSYALSSILRCIGLVGCCCSFFIFLTFLAIGSLYYLSFAMQTVNPNGKAVLITGCDTGFGNTLALHLDKLGFRVFAGCLFADKGGEGATSLKETGSNKLHVLQLDVTNEEEIKAARKMVDELLPKDESLWAVVNNAGITTFGNVEWVPVSVVKKMADVNIFGMISVIKEFLPLLRKSKGRVVNVSSTLGRLSAPMRSSYVLTKYAVEGFSDSLRYEMKEFGIDVSIIEPGNFVMATGIFTPESVAKIADEMWNAMSEETKELYGEGKFKEIVEAMKTFTIAGETDQSLVIVAFEEAVTQKYPQVRYQPADLSYKTKIFAATHFPEWLFDFFYSGYLKR